MDGADHQVVASLLVACHPRSDGVNISAGFPSAVGGCLADPLLRRSKPESRVTSNDGSAISFKSPQCHRRQKLRSVVAEAMDRVRATCRPAAMNCRQATSSLQGAKRGHLGRGSLLVDGGDGRQRHADRGECQPGPRDRGAAKTKKKKKKTRPRTPRPAASRRPRGRGDCRPSRRRSPSSGDDGRPTFWRSTRGWKRRGRRNMARAVRWSLRGQARRRADRRLPQKTAHCRAETLKVAQDAGHDAAKLGGHQEVLPKLVEEITYACRETGSGFVAGQPGDQAARQGRPAERQRVRRSFRDIRRALPRKAEQLQAMISYSRSTSESPRRIQRVRRSTRRH